MIKTIDLSGEWRLSLSDKQQTALPTAFGDTIILPDSLSNAKKCPKNENRDTGYMTDTYSFEGSAWFERDFVLDDDYENISFSMERTRLTTLYVDGKEIGSRDSLCTPHVYSLNGLNKGSHTILVCVSNVGYPTRGGHLTSPDTQTNWLGITGKIELIIHGFAYAENVMICSDIERNIVTVTADVVGKDSGEARISVDGIGEITSNYDNGKLLAKLPMGAEKRFWSEYEHNIFTLSIDIDGDITTAPFGMRKISSNGLKLLINGKQVFLRGKHDGLVFPKTGYAPTDVNSWLDVMKTAKSYGINHYRFHTCCPPDAAFTAADMLGIYMEPELPFWGTITAEGEENHNAAEQSYLVKLGFEMLREYGNHPSFVMMSMGNELWGSHDRINEIIHGFKAYDSRHFYTSGSNNFQFYPAFLKEEDFWTGVRFDKYRLIRGSYAMCDAPLGHIQTDAPNASHCYDDIIVPKTVVSESSETGSKTVEIQYGTGVKTVSADAVGEVLVPNLPVISHEVGQYDMYPDFDEGKLYTGSIKPLYLDVFKERLEKKNLFGDWRKFFKASCALAVDCYKAEIEAALRSKNLLGFQLLDLQDFPGQGVALVGVLNPLMQPKGAVTEERWRGFCSDTVLMARTEKFVYGAGEKIKADILISCCEFEKLHGTVSCTLDGKEITSFEIPQLSERLTEIGHIELDTAKINAPVSARLEISIVNTQMHNDYTFYIYPCDEVGISEKEIKSNGKTLVISRTLEQAEKLVSEGVKTLLVPERKENDVDGTYCTDFWNYPMFASISRSLNRALPTGTMGLSIDKENPIMKRFLSNSYTTPQWFDFISHAHCANLDGEEGVSIIAESIDNIERCSRLGVLYEKNGIPVCTSRLWEIAENLEIKTLAAALVMQYGK